MRTCRRNLTETIRRFVLVGGVVAGLAGCADYERSLLPGSSASLAQDRIMMVRKDPPTFGYDRLTVHRGAFPDVDVFVDREGLPDFLAETRNHGRQYLIFYYLSRREAYACRDLPGRGRGVEFSGPYPVTDHEYEVLDGFRKGGKPSG